MLAEEFLDPLGFRWTNYGVAPEDTDEVALNYLTGPTTLPPLSTLLTRALGAPLDELVETTNDDRFVTGVVPAGNLVTTAHELSRFFEVMRCGGELDGVRVIETDTIRKALEEQSHLEIDFSLGFPTRFSYGLMLGAQILSALRPRHAARVRPPRLHEHPRLGRPAARDLGRDPHERQADPLSRAAALPDVLAAHHHGVAEGERVGDAALARSLAGRVPVRLAAVALVALGRIAADVHLGAVNTWSVPWALPFLSSPLRLSSPVLSPSAGSVWRIPSERSSRSSSSVPTLGSSGP